MIKLVCQVIVFFFVTLLSAPLMGVRAEGEPSELVVDRFSGKTTKDGIPEGWKALTFKKVPNPSKYILIEEDGNYLVKAVSRNGASGIFKEMDTDPNIYPILSWRWKVENILEKGDASKKSGDDYPARIYVAFKYDPKKASFWEKTKYGAAKIAYGKYPPKGALNYIWDNRLDVGTAIDNAFTDSVKMIVIQSGREKVGEWVSEERNILEDYRNLFGSEPPVISFIAIMTDTDNTGESAVAYYDDLVLRRR